MVAASAPLMAALRAVRSLELSSWCIGAGAIRSLVWNSLHGFSGASYGDDVDVAYFDPHAASGHEAQLQDRLRCLCPTIDWEVTNQAKVHEWLVDDSGHAVAPLTSLEDGLATWPEFATCVGVHLDINDSVHVIAPYGLADLFELRVRHNPRRASYSTFLARVQSKGFRSRWPKLAVQAGV
ncbi:hypothetical protein GG851_13225 [Bordetella petrii]|nr:hypothetical protein [Bordetella petrii]